MKEINLNKSVITAAALVISMGILGCAKKNEAKKYDVAVQFSSYTTAFKRGPDSSFKMALDKMTKYFLPQSQAAVTSLKLCFKRVRFKAQETATENPETSEDNIDFNLGEVTLSSSATSLGTITLPEGTYRRIEFDLENHCSSGKSIQLTNGSGSFTSTDRVTIKFEGSFTADSSGTLTLGVQQILTQLNSYTGSGTLKNSAEAASGILSE